MATNQVLVLNTAQFLFRDVTDFPSSGVGPPTTAGNDLRYGTPTQVQIDLTSLSAAAAWQSAKLDLGATRSGLWVMSACIETVSTFPVAGETFDFYWSESPNATVGTGNAGEASGADGTYAPTSLAANLNQMTKIGSLICTNDAINIGPVGEISPWYQYGSLIVVNNTAVATHTVMDETHIVLTSVVEDIQAAA